MEEHPQERPHAIMIPYPLQGHIIPFVNLAIKLASKGFTITFINTESIHHQITKAHSSSPTNDIFYESRKLGLDIRYTTISDGFPIEFDRSLNHDEFFEGVLHGFGDHVDDLMRKLIQTSPRVSCLVSDTFYVWLSTICNKYNLVNVSFWTEPVLVLTLYYHMHLLKLNGHFACDNTREDTIDYIPGVEAIDPKDLMSYLQSRDISTVVHRIIFKAFEDVKNADFIICNTIQELESSTIQALQVQQPTYAIGPIFPIGFTKINVSTSLWTEVDCTQWLNTKPNGSVLYVSFGSYAHCSRSDILEIAHGLALSKVNFIWVLRPDIISSDETDFLSSEYYDDVNDRAMIVPWCCQINVISHPGVGGFLTHCGWNSILESIWCSVPLLCFPLLTDQFTNRKLVVDDWKIGINLCDRKPVTRDEVAQNICRLMSGEISNELRNNVTGLKETLGNALAEGGSSDQNFDGFIDEVKVKIRNKCGFQEVHNKLLS